MVPLCPSVGLPVPVTRASVAHQVGIGSPLSWALIAHNAGNECPNIGLIFGQYSFDSLRYLKCIFEILKMTFSDV